MSNNSSPSTPRYGGDEFHRRLAGIPMEDSPNADRQSPVLLQLEAHNNFRYGEMSQPDDSGYSSNQDTQVGHEAWHRVFSPLYPQAEPSPPSPRLSQMENIVRSLSPVLAEEASPDMFATATPRAYVLRMRNDLFPVSGSLSPSMLDLPQVGMSPRHNMLFAGEILNTTRHSGEQSPEMDWSDDGDDEVLNRHMEAYETDEELNRHMDAYEGFGGV